MIMRQARVLDPQQQLDTIMDVHIADGKIQAMAADLHIADAQIIDAKGHILCPSFTDLLTYLRQPGNAQKGTIASETRAAASAGFSTLLASPDTQPASDSTAVLELVQDRAEQAGYCQILPVAALTQGLQSTHLSNMLGLNKAGAIAFSNAGYDFADNTVLVRCYEYAATYNLKIFVQARDAALSNGHMHDGILATQLGLNGIPVIAETLAIGRHLQIMQHTGVSCHFQQLSSAAGVAMVRQAKAQGLAISADVDLAHLCFTEQQIQGYASQYHVQPPLRHERDRQALLAGLADGTIDAIVSAHQPHEAAAKQAPFADTATGMAMYDIFIPLLLSLQDQADLSLMQLIAALGKQSAAIAGLEHMGLTIGAKANLCLIDPHKCWQLTAHSQQSHGANQCRNNSELKGRVVLTLRDGHITWQA
jgi:dihydroorotase